MRQLFEGRGMTTETHDTLVERLQRRMTEYQQGVVRLHLCHRQHKQIARELGKTPDGVRRVLRNLSEQRRLPERVQWPVPRP